MDIPIVDGLSEDQVLTLAYCRSFDQYVSMYEGYRAGKCPFCVPMDSEKNRVICSIQGWRMWENPFALKHTATHLIMAPIRHVGPRDRLRVSDFAAAGELFVWARDTYKFEGGGFAMRFGSPQRSACSVLHLHANIIIPDLTGNVRVTLAKEPHEVAEQVARMHVFEKLRQGVLFNGLSREERALVEGRL